MSLRQKLLAVKPAHRPLIFGHRGSPTHAVENTLESFQRAFEEGADGVELDVRVTRDRVAVVFHDEALSSREKLSELPFAAMQSLAQASGVPIFSLETVLTNASGRGYLDIEIKDVAACELIIPLTAGILPENSYVFSSFLPEAILECRRLAEQVPVIWIVESAKEFPLHLMQMDELNATAYAPWHETLTPEIAREFIARGIPLVTFTVNDPAQALRLAEMGVMGIISDRPGILRSAFPDRKTA